MPFNMFSNAEHMRIEAAVQLNNAPNEHTSRGRLWSLLEIPTRLESYQSSTDACLNVHLPLQIYIIYRVTPPHTTLSLLSFPKQVWLPIWFDDLCLANKQM